MYSQCPECQARFRVTADVLRAARGTVRCGRCGTAFDALERLSDSLPPPAPEPDALLSEPVAESLSEPGREASVAGEFSFNVQDLDQALVAAPEWPLQAEPQPTAEAATIEFAADAVEPPVVLVDERVPMEDITLEGERIQIEPPPELAEESADLDSTDEFEVLRQVPDSAYPEEDEEVQRSLQVLVKQLAAELPSAPPGPEAVADEVFRQAPGLDAAALAIEPDVAEIFGAGEPRPADPGRIELDLDLELDLETGPATEAPLEFDPESAEIFAEPAVPAAAPAPTPTLTAAPTPAPAPTPTPPPAAAPVPLSAQRWRQPETTAEPEPAESEPEARSAAGTFAWALSGLVLALALAAQFGHHFRQDLVRHPMVGPVLRTVYERFGIELTPNWDLGGFEIRQWGNDTDAGAAGRMVVRASITNRASFPQPHPILRLELEDRFGNSVASRDFEPADYLKNPAQASRLVAPGSSSEAELSLASTSRDAVGYRLDVCLRESATLLRCANGPG